MHDTVTTGWIFMVSGKSNSMALLETIFRTWYGLAHLSVSLRVGHLAMLRFCVESMTLSPTLYSGASE